MKPMNDRTQLEQPPAARQPAPRQRFRIQKLEERIAPAKGGMGTLRGCAQRTGTCS